MLTLSSQRACGQPTSGNIRPLVEYVRVGPHREIGVRIMPKALGQITPLEPLRRDLEGQGSEFDLRPDHNLLAHFVSLLISFQRLGTRRTTSRGFRQSVLFSSQRWNR